MRRLILVWRVRERERGATAVLTALLLVVLVGFTGLAVDGGATMAKQQELQNGADAAALAAAQECAENGCVAIDSVAGPYGEANVSNEKPSVSTSFTVDAAAQTVKATVTGTQSHWFLPVVGVGASVLNADATAIWGSPSDGPAMMPLSISLCSFGAAALGTEMEIYVPSGGGAADGCTWNNEYPPGSFGWLGPSCDSLPEIVVGELAPTDPGVDTPSDCDWSSFVGKTVLIPVFSDYNEDDPSTKEVWIEKFAAFELAGIRYGNGAGKQVGESCSYAAPEYDPSLMHKLCVKGKFVEYVFSADGYGVDEGETSEVDVVKLID